MLKKIGHACAALGIATGIGITLLATEANAGGPRPCYRCTGGWCCY